MGAICQWPAWVKPRLEEPWSREGQKKKVRIFAETHSRRPGLSARENEVHRRLVPALSGQSQTDKVTVSGSDH